MNRLKLDNLGGLPLTQDILAFLQSSGHDALGALAVLSGELVIIHGVVTAGGSNSNGWVAINGELLPFEGGTITGTVSIIETITQKTYEDDGDKDLLIARKVANTVAGTFNLADFKRLPRLDYVAPPGLITQFGGSAAPLGWLLCDGAEASRVTYADLFAVVGTTYGVGNGTTTFNLPDFRGRVLAGRDALDTDFNELGEMGGAKLHTLTVDQVPALTVTVPFGRTKRGEGGDPNHAAAAPDGDTFGTAFNKTGTTNGGGLAHNNLQPYSVVNHIIKF